MFEGGGSRFAARRWAVALLASLFALSLAIYLSTAQPTVGDGDSAKFQLVARVLGIPHSTGYPLYVLLAHLFTFLPLGDVAFRVTLFSAVAGGAAVGVLGLTVWLLTRDPLAAAGAALLFAWSPAFWSQAVIAEVYGLNALFVAAVVFLFLLWRRYRRPWMWASGLAVYALSLGNHGSMLLLAPALLWLVAATEPRMLTRPRNLVLAAGILALGAAQYLWLFLRATQHPPFCEHCPDTLARFAWYLSGAQFRSQFLAFPLGQLVRRLGHYPDLLLAQFGPLPVAVGVVGTIALVATDWRGLVFLALALVGDVLFALDYDIVDYGNLLIPSYLLFALGVGVGLATVARLLASVTRLLPRPAGTRVASGVWALAVVGLMLWPLWANYGLVDESSDRATLDEAETLLAMIPTDGVLVMPPCCDFYGRAMAVFYLQQVEGLRPDVEIVSFDPGDPALGVRPIYVPQDGRVVSLLAEERPAVLPRVGVRLQHVLEQHYVLRPLDSSTTPLWVALDGLPDGSLLLLAGRHPVSYSVDDGAAGSQVEVSLRRFGFRDVDWPGRGAHAMVGLRGAAPGTALVVWNPQVVDLRLRAGEPVAATGMLSPVSLHLVVSDADADIVVDGRNLSAHHWGTNLVALAPGSGDPLLMAYFDTETFLLNDVRAYRILAVRQEGGE